MKTDIWMPLIIGDYLKDTRHLSLEEHGAYLLILMELWVKSNSIPEKLVGRILGNPNNWENVWEILKPLFEINNGVVSHNKIERLKIEWDEKKDSKEFGAAVTNFKKHGIPIPPKFADRYEIYAKRTAERNAERTAKHSAKGNAKLTPSSSSSSSSLYSSAKSNKKDLSPEFFEVANLLKDEILKIKQQKITDSHLESWANDVRLMVERDNRPLDSIKSLISEVFGMSEAPNGFSWAKNIGSMGTLRTRWNEGKIFIGMDTSGPYIFTEKDFK